MAKLIPLTRGFSAIVDDADFDWLSLWRWLILGDRYAARFEKIENSRKLVLLHRFIMNAPAQMEVDHINRNKLDCQKSNLRLATRAQNMRNKAKRHGAKTSASFKGVWHEHQLWSAAICVNNKNLYLGLYATEIDAAHAYDAAARTHHGEFACLNFPDFSGDYPYSRKSPTVSTSQYRGVSFEQRRSSWKAATMVKGKSFHLGYFTSELDAARAYDAGARIHHGELACLNFPQERP
jgi:hypothetical protein